MEIVITNINVGCYPVGENITGCKIRQVPKLQEDGTLTVTFTAVNSLYEPIPIRSVLLEQTIDVDWAVVVDPHPN